MHLASFQSVYIERPEPLKDGRLLRRRDDRSEDEYHEDAKLQWKKFGLGHWALVLFGLGPKKFHSAE